MALGSPVVLPDIVSMNGLWIFDSTVICGLGAAAIFADVAELLVAYQMSFNYKQDPQFSIIPRIQAFLLGWKCKCFRIEFICTNTT